MLILQERYRKQPSANWVIPAKNVAVNARRWYSSFCTWGSNSFWSNVPSKRDTTATGPIAIYLKLPIRAYIKGGTKLLSAQFDGNFFLEVLRRASRVNLSCMSKGVKIAWKYSGTAYTAHIVDPSWQVLNMQCPTWWRWDMLWIKTKDFSRAATQCVSRA